MCYTTDENDDLLYRDFLVSAHTGGCFMTCTNWCSDVSASFFCIASLIHMASRVAWHLVKMVMMSMIKGVSVSDYNKVSPFLVPW